MTTLPVLTVTDTGLSVWQPDALTADQPAHEALLSWLKAHGLDPWLLPATEPIVIDRAARTITYKRVLTDSNGTSKESINGVLVEEVVHHLDRDIDPWPRELVALSCAEVTVESALDTAMAEVRAWARRHENALPTRPPQSARAVSDLLLDLNRLLDELTSGSPKRHDS